MYTCLTNKVSIPNICSPNEDVGAAIYSITDISGFSLESISKINDSEQKMFDFLSNMNRLAAIDVSNDIKSNLSMLPVKAKGTIDSGSTTKSIRNISTSCLNKGVKIVKKNTTNKLLKLIIRKIKVHSDDVTTVVVTVSDSYGIQYNYQIPIDPILKSGELVGPTYQGKPLEVQGETCLIYSSMERQGRSILPNCNCTKDRNTCVTIYGYNNSNGSENNIESGGIEVEFECMCDLDSLICSTDNEMLATLQLNKLAEKLAYHKANSNEKNTYTIYQEKYTKEDGETVQVNHYKKIYKEKLKEYVEYLMDFLNSKEDGICITCNKLRVVSVI